MTYALIMDDYDVWMEGYNVTGQHQDASYLGKYAAPSFRLACKMALIANNYDMQYYSEERNSYWGCKLYMNEVEARKNFG